MIEICFSGDIHGKIDDLFQFQKLFWSLGPQYSAAKILFLGDYVDRGRFGLEVVGYLFAQKVLAPEKVFLLRGNHEERVIQQQFDFYTYGIA